MAGADLRAADFEVMHMLAVRDDKQDGQGVPAGQGAEDGHGLYGD